MAVLRLPQEADISAETDLLFDAAQIRPQPIIHSRGGRFGEVMAERIRELGLERGRIGLLEIDPRFGDYLPVNQYDAL